MPLVDWQYYPAYDRPPMKLEKIIELFESNYDLIRSDRHNLVSDSVLKILRTPLEQEGFVVEKGKGISERLRVPVLFGRNGRIEKAFEADAYHREMKIVVEVEAGRAVTNFQFLKDIFEACVMADVDYLVIGVRKNYKGKKDFEIVTAKFLDSLYANPRLKLPIKGIL